MLFLSGPLLCAAASSDDVLRSAWKDARLAAHNEAVQISVQSQSINPIEKAELKFDRGELNKNDVKYGLRVYPRGYTEHKTTRRYQEAIEKNEKSAQGEALSKLLASRYDLLSRIVLLKEKKKISDELTNVSRKASKALSYAAQKDRAELKSYLKTKADLEKVDVKIADVERDYKNLQTELKELSFGNVENFETSDVNEMDDIRKHLETSLSKQDSPTLSTKVAEFDLQKLRAGMDYERAKDDKWFDHIEVSMKDDQKEKVYGVEVSFNLPFAGAPDLSRIDKESRELREKAKVLETLQTSGREYKNALAELTTLLDLHKSLKASQAKMNISQMKKASAAISSQDPLLSLELQKSWYESREHILDVEFRIRSLYILFLHESSTLADAPDVNYFSKSLKRIL